METQTHLIYCGSNFDFIGTELSELDMINIQENPDYEFLPGHKYLVFWNDDAKLKSLDDQAFEHVRRKVHLGPRGEGFYDLTKMNYLITREGIIFKFVYKNYTRQIEWLEEDKYEAMLPILRQIRLKARNAELETGISKKSGRPWYRLVFDTMKDISGDILDFIKRDDYIKEPAGSISYYKVIRNKDDIKNSFDYFQKTEQMYGLDYETNSFPFDDPEFFVMGLGIVGENGVGAYFDLEWLQTMDPDGWRYFKDRYREFLGKYENSVTYNNAFEMKVTYLILNKINLFDEASTINKLDGVVYKRFSLKYTAMKNLYVASWDDFFESLTEKTLPQLFGIREGGDKKDLPWVKDDDGLPRLEYEEFLAKCGLEDDKESQDMFKSGSDQYLAVRNDYNYSKWYQNNPVWDKLKSDFPNDINEFERLIGKYFGYSYKCIPATILGEYCCKDSYYTVLLKKLALERYSQQAWDCYNNNLRLEALLGLTGIYIDEDLRKKMFDYSAYRSSYGKLNTIRFFLTEKIRRFGKVDIDSIQEVGNVLNHGFDISNSKSILTNERVIDPKSPRGVNEKFLEEIFGTELSNEILETIKVTCLRIEKKSRARKVFKVVDNILQERWNLLKLNNSCKVTVSGVEYEIGMDYPSLMEYCSYKIKLKMVDFYLSQMKYDEQIFKIKLYGTNEEVSISDVIGNTVTEGDDKGSFSFPKFLDKTIYNASSILTSVQFKFLYINRFWNYIMKNALSEGKFDFLSCDYPEITEEDYQELIKKGNKLAILFDLARNIVSDNLDKLKRSRFYKFYENDNDVISLVYNNIFYEKGLRQPNKRRDKDGNPEMELIPLANEFMDLLKDINDRKLDGMLIDITHLEGYNIAKGYESILDRIYNHLDEIDVSERSLESFAKMSYCYYSGKKYYKLVTTYLEGQFTKYTVMSDLPNEDGISTRKYGGNIFKMYPSFQALSKKSKRWSSGMHTISSVSETKRVVSTPPGYLLSYFDISGAEVRFISYESQDPYMLDCYAKNLDPYINFAATIVYPERAGDMPFLKSIRKEFKTILLGKLYGMANETLAGRIGKSLEETNRIVDLFFSKATGLKRFIEEKSQWALDHPGYVDTFFGDVMVVGDDDGDDKLARLGINQHIQNAASVTLGNGFFQCIQNSIHGSDEVIKNGIIRPINVVHDSSQNYFETRLLFDIYPYYHKYMSDFCFDQYGVRYEFDLEIGQNYYDMLEMKTIDKDTLKFSGDHTSIQKFMKKLLEPEANLDFKINKFTDEEGKDIPFEIVNGNFCKTFVVEDDRYKPSIYSSPVEGFYMKDGGNAEFEEDYSEFNLEISRK